MNHIRQCNQLTRLRYFYTHDNIITPDDLNEHHIYNNNQTVASKNLEHKLGKRNLSKKKTPVNQAKPH